MSDDIPIEEFEKMVEETEDSPPTVAITYYTNDLLNSIRLDVNTIASVVSELKWWLDLLMYALLGACVGWAIGSLLL